MAQHVEKQLVKFTIFATIFVLLVLAPALCNGHSDGDRPSFKYSKEANENFDPKKETPHHHHHDHDDHHHNHDEHHHHHHDHDEHHHDHDDEHHHHHSDNVYGSTKNNLGIVAKNILLSFNLCQNKLHNRFFVV